MELEPSDYLMFVAFIISILFALSYGLLAPWYKAPLGWVIFLYAISMVALLFLLCYGVVLGQRIDEVWRTVVMGGLVLGLAAKVVIFYVERHKGLSHSRKVEPHEASRSMVQR